MTPESAPFIARVDAVEARLAEHAAATHDGLTPAHPGNDERWEAAQVWAHLAEFIDYWIPQAQQVIAGAGDGPVAFGRTKADPGRIEAIETGRSVDVAAQWTSLQAAIQRLRDFISGLGTAAWGVDGTHPTLGTMPLSRIVDEFLVGHLEEHAAQLDLLRQS